MSSRRILILLLATSFIFAQEGFGNDIRFDRDIRPILSDKCFHCHGPDEEHREANLRLDLEESARESGIIAGNPEESEFVQRILSTDPDLQMPPVSAKKPLSSGEKDLLRRWVEQGAKWSGHWAFLPISAPEVPAIDSSRSDLNAIDHFIIERLRREGLELSSEANRRTLIRRVTFDLTGLPPTPEEVQAFIEDNSANAYEKLVDRLLDSQHYGERMALMWLDAARYGDTSVFHADGPRDMWAWRDLVVKSYNSNMPFNEFSIEQLAGDQLPEPTVDQLVASGFNRNNGTTDEGGAIAEEYRVEYAVDRVKTTSTLWLGLTMECGQCHDHKFDPISQKDYYRFYAFFNVSADGGMQTRSGNAEPKVAVPDPEKEKLLPGVREQLAAIENQLKERTSASEPDLQAWIQDQESALASGEQTLLPEEPLLQFSFDEGEGTTIKDAVDTARQGTIQGKTVWETGRFGKCLKLDGTTFVDLGNLASFERTEQFSYGGWIFPEKTPSGAILARMDNNNGFRGYDLLLSGGAVEVHMIHKWPGNAVKVRTKKALEADKWQHVFATYDGSSKAAGVKIYVDGEQWETNVEQDGLTDTIKTEKSLLIGSRHPDSRYKGLIDDVRIFEKTLAPDQVQALASASPITPILQLDADERTSEQVAQLRDFYLRNADEPYKNLLKQQEDIQAREKQLMEPLTTVMVMKDADSPRDTYLLNRGRYDSPTDLKVDRGTPAILPPMPEHAPRNRLGMARWLFQADHPLTARVTVNRYWQMLFGTGLVATPEDFGSQGEFPSHPELLDWLATDFRDNGWNVKRTIKQLVLSATYRQSATVSPDLLVKDPDNRLLARGPRFRLQGEFIRDNALAMSGLLNQEMGGPGVKPYQPPGLWAEVGLGGNPKFVQDHGEKLYRRSLYTYWKRSAPPPAMSIFDAPTREKCAVRRSRTNTPLQALVTLNDVQFVEASRHLAERILTSGGDSPESRISFAYLLATSREPTPRELASLRKVLEIAQTYYAGNEEAAKNLLSAGESPRSESLDLAEHAAWTILASTILNLDETLTRG
ncbi:MAG: DUF1553 domain-containing protein [Planctomycetaceae bacterium]|nr:DUF1553 domain-containing protein [Planctomycetaceae bacterium]